MLYSIDEIGELLKGNILTYVSIKNTYNVKKGYIVDVFTKDTNKPCCSTFIKLKSLNKNVYWEINTLKNMYLSNVKPKKRRSNFKIMIDSYLKK